MFVAYSDETGVGDINAEPITVVAAILINIDSQWEGVRTDIEALVSNPRLVPPEKRDRFIFHARKFFGQIHRPEYQELARTFLAIPAKRRLPILYGAVHREGFAATVPEFAATHTPKQLVGAIQGLAFYLCAQRINAAIELFRPQEKILWIAASTEAAQHMKDFLRLAQDRPIVPGFAVSQLRQVVDTIYFGHASESRALQLADACNFVIVSKLLGKRVVEPYYPLIVPQLTTNPVLFHPDGTRAEGVDFNANGEV